MAEDWTSTTQRIHKWNFTQNTAVAYNISNDISGIDLESLSVIGNYLYAYDANTKTFHRYDCETMTYGEASFTVGSDVDPIGIASDGNIIKLFNNLSGGVYNPNSGEFDKSFDNVYDLYL